MKKRVSPYVYPGLNHTSQLRIKSDSSVMITPEEILEIVSKNCNVSVGDILSKTRIREIVEARQLFCYIIRERFGYPLSKVGRMVNRDHATAIYSIKSHKDRCDVLRDYRELTKRVISEVDTLYSTHHK